MSLPWILCNWYTDWMDGSWDGAFLVLIALLPRLLLAARPGFA